MASNPLTYITAALEAAELIVVGTGTSDSEGLQVQVLVDSSIKGTPPHSDLTVGSAGMAGEVSGRQQVFALIADGSSLDLAPSPASPLLTPLRVARFLDGGDLRDPPTDSDRLAEIASKSDIVVHALITGTDLGTKGRVDEVIWQSDPDAMHPGEIVEVPRSAHWDLVLGPANAHWIINRTGEAGRWTLVAPPASLGLSDLKTLGWG